MKKGFMFYFGFFLLILFGGFLVVLVLMLFNPGQTILGMQYFSNNERTILQTTTNAEKTELKLAENGKYEKIEINVDYASVSVQKNEDFDKTGVVIINNSKGFVLAKDAVEWNYSVLIDGNSLKINISEPSAFLFFSKDIKVIVHLADSEANPFSNTEFDITTKTGNVTIGGSSESPYAYDFNVGNIDVKSETGSLSVTRRVNYESEGEKQTFKKMILSLGSGSFSSSAKVLNVKDFGFISTTGNFTATNLNITNPGAIKTNAGTIRIGKLAGDMTVECQNGYFKISEMVGNLNMPSADIKMDSPKFYVDKIDGDLTVLEGQNAYFQVKEVTGDVNMTLTSGSVKLGESSEKYLSKSVIVKTTSGNVQAYIAGNEASAKEIETEGGQIKLYLCGQVKGDTNVHSKTGRVYTYMMLGKSYTFNFSYYGDAENYDMKKVKFVDYPNVELTNPFVYNTDGVATVNIFTNNNIELAMFE